MKIVNLETIIDVQSWCRTWPPNGSNHIRAKQKLLRKHKGACKSSWGRIGSLKSIYTNNSLEFGKACEDLSWNHCTSAPHRSETNGDCWESSAQSERRYLCSIVAIRSGWKLVGRFFGMFYLSAKHLRSLVWWENPIRKTFWKTIKGPIIPFGSLVEYHPITAKDQSRIHQFGKKVLPGLFLGYALYGEGIWKGDVLIQDLDVLKRRHIYGSRPWGAGKLGRARIHARRLNAKEEIFPKEYGNFIFPVADGRIKFDGGSQELRTSTLIRHRPIQGESTIDFLGESEGSLPPPQDSFPDAGEAINDFWSMSGSFIYRHHVEPRVKLYSPREESFPIPLKYIDVSRTTRTNLDVKQEKRIDDYWNIDGSRDLSGSWTVFTQFIKWDFSRRIFVVRGETDKKAANIQARSFMARTPGNQWESTPSWRRSKSGPMMVKKC